MIDRDESQESGLPTVALAKVGADSRETGVGSQEP